MAGLLGRSPSTVSREIDRNGGYIAAAHAGGYRGNVEQPDHRAVGKTRPAAQISLD
jgi:IS30 family transposase